MPIFTRNKDKGTLVTAATLGREITTTSTTSKSAMEELLVAATACMKKQSCQ